MHHIVALSKGGTDETANLVLLCESCHQDADVGLLKPARVYRGRTVLRGGSVRNGVRFYRAPLTPTPLP